MNGNPPGARPGSPAGGGPDRTPAARLPHRAMGTLHMSVQRGNETAVAAVELQLAGADPQLALVVSEGPMCPNEKPVISETKGRGSDPRRHGGNQLSGLKIGGTSNPAS